MVARSIWAEGQRARNASLILIDQLLYRCATVDTEQLTGNKRGAV